MKHFIALLLTLASVNAFADTYMSGVTGGADIHLDVITDWSKINQITTPVSAWLGYRYNKLLLYGGGSMNLWNFLPPWNLFPPKKPTSKFSTTPFSLFGGFTFGKDTRIGLNVGYTFDPTNDVFFEPVIKFGKTANFGISAKFYVNEPWPPSSVGISIGFTVGGNKERTKKGSEKKSGTSQPETTAARNNQPSDPYQQGYPQNQPYQNQAYPNQPYQQNPYQNQPYPYQPYPYQPYPPYPNQPYQPYPYQPVPYPYQQGYPQNQPYQPSPQPNQPSPTQQPSQPITGQEASPEQPAPEKPSYESNIDRLRREGNSVFVLGDD
jgi:hypothetical protein